MPDIKWSAFANGGAQQAGDELVGLRGGANYRITPTLVPAAGANGTILTSSTGAWIASTVTWPNVFALNDMLYASAANTVSALTKLNNAVLGSDATGVPTWRALTDGQLLIGSSSGAPLAANITAGTGINVTSGANSITVSGTGGGLAWSTDATGTIAAAIDNGYVCGAAGLTSATLPATAAVGSVVALEGLGAGGWVVQAPGAQTVQVGSGVTSAGGTVTSAAATDNIYVRCIVANSVWRVTTTNSAGLTIA